MPREALEASLKEITEGILAMGSMVEQAIDSAVDSLKRRDRDLSERIIKDDDLIDQKRFHLEEACIRLIATQQPMAADLRLLVSVLNIIVELERMGDYAEGIAKISIAIGDEPPLKPLIDIPRMAVKASNMLSRSLDALVNRDLVGAIQVCNDDDEVDALYDQVYRELLTFMIQDAKTIERATYLLWVAHDLERIADRATNISERVIYLLTGKLTGIETSNK